MCECATEDRKAELKQHKKTSRANRAVTSQLEVELSCVVRALVITTALNGVLVFGVLSSAAAAALAPPINSECCWADWVLLLLVAVLKQVSKRKSLRILFCVFTFPVL